MAQRAAFAILATLWAACQPPAQAVDRPEAAPGPRPSASLSPLKSPPPAPASARSRAELLEPLHRVIREHDAEFEQCYREGLRRDRKLVGRIVVRLIVDRDGAVTDVTDISDQFGDKAAPGLPNAEHPIPDPQVRQCVLRLYGALRFPAQRSNGVTLTYPMFFAPPRREQVNEELQ